MARDHAPRRRFPLTLPAGLDPRRGGRWEQAIVELVELRIERCRTLQR
ncbi:MAG: hypothetical protein II786_00510 [Muribaculaceae bacterium]|nr:hypothetical protein [Muribaculaceae bacterium]